MKQVLHLAQERGSANHGWLNSHHSFSFANYYNPQKMNFGLLRVLNDDTVAPGMGFGKHPHDNMEIISIPLQGDLEHEDSMGNKAVIREGEIQAMSAGTGIFHSEYNASKSDEVKFLQIWIFPREKDVAPRYDQIVLPDLSKANTLHQVLSPNPDDAGIWVHQDAWFNMGTFNNGASQSYDIKRSNNGVYAFIIDGSFEIEGQKLSKRDALGLWEIDTIQIKSLEAGSRLLLIDVPMNFS
jgi:redox-sensitive bicupin YhaK (pirin superfamily)